MLPISFQPFYNTEVSNQKIHLLVNENNSLKNEINRLEVEKILATKRIELPEPVRSTVYKKRFPRICYYFARSEECRFGPKCHFIHVTPKYSTLEEVCALRINLEDAIALGNSNLEQLVRVQDELIQLNAMVGLHALKRSIFDMVCYYIIYPKDPPLNMIITGEPGVGKTEIAKLLGKMLCKLNVLGSNEFVQASRSELVGQYLGSTSKNTQKLIDKAENGVLFIDEAYSLGAESTTKTDSFAKECIDTLTLNLTKKRFLCILAGYKQDIEKCVLGNNRGLDRRFPLRLDISSYSEQELFEIFQKQITENMRDWQLSPEVDFGLFTSYCRVFSAGPASVKTLVQFLKLQSASRLVKDRNTENKKILKKDFQSAIELWHHTLKF